MNRQEADEKATRLRQEIMSLSGEIRAVAMAMHGACSWDSSESTIGSGYMALSRLLTLMQGALKENEQLYATGFSDE